ncbi:dihydropyrimidinase [Roseivivax isoporae]|uniref:Dihydropyrimidinase n=1 Tax=Roseivivax isoporae LMG 25204 TaxID=1449351 RepID=X7F3V9_9RHOB|nr:dihydropyrimidinase [Roseivivax isoporae]ETX27480.1 dihydropyrimidinase [Roseivivax isoporae LMG 25204]
MFDLVITGGTVATASDTFRADIGITDGRIAALGHELQGRDRIDASGRLVLPGGIEAHCHIAQESATGGMTSDDYTSGSISAAFGGNACFVPFAAQHRGMGVTETLDLYDSRATGASVIDYGYHLIVADPTEKVLTEELPAAFARGVTSFKVFMTYDLMRIDDRQFLDILTVARTHGALTMVHAENSGMISWMSDRLVAGGHTAPRYHAPSHPALAEAEAINRAISLARLVDAPLFIVHVSTPEGAGLVSDARMAGAKVFGETCTQYLFLTRDDLDRPGMEGAKFMCSPPLRDRGTQEALWRHLQAGTFSIFSSDHAPYRFDETGKLSKGPDATFKQIANGMPGIGARLPMLFSEGVAKGRITLQQFVALSATNAARLYGLRDKGSIAIGMDADIAIWDPEARHVISVETQHDNMDYSPFEGWEVTGRPVCVLSRGTRVIEDGRLLAAPGHGRYVARDRTDLTGHPGHLAPELDPATNFGARIAP